MPVQLPCATPDCKYGPDGAVYKTPALDFADAIQLLNIHRVDAHGVQAGGGGGAGGGVIKTHLSKIPRPEISGGSSQEDFRQFKVKWGQYVRSSNETSPPFLKNRK